MTTSTSTEDVWKKLQNGSCFVALQKAIKDAIRLQLIDSGHFGWQSAVSQPNPLQAELPLLCDYLTFIYQ